MTGHLDGLLQLLSDQADRHGLYLMFAAFVGFIVLAAVMWGGTPLLPHDHDALADDPADELAPTPLGGRSRRYFQCPSCGARSHHPDDLRHGYCGRCKAYTGRPDGLDIHTDHRRTA